MCICVRACVRARVFACVRACVRFCVCACVRACMHAFWRFCMRFTMQNPAPKYRTVPCDTFRPPKRLREPLRSLSKLLRQPLSPTGDAFGGANQASDRRTVPCNGFFKSVRFFEMIFYSTLRLRPAAPRAVGPQPNMEQHALTHTHTRIHTRAHTYTPWLRSERCHKKIKTQGEHS